MTEPTTPTGKRMLERSAWDEGLRCHRVRVLNPAGPEDLANAILAIEAEAREQALADESVSPAPNSDHTLDVIRERHTAVLHGQMCDYDHSAWLCDAALFRDALDMMTIRANGMESARDAARALADELADALREVSNYGDHDESPCWCDPDRMRVGLPHDIGCDHARAALAKWEASRG